MERRLRRFGPSSKLPHRRALVEGEGVDILLRPARAGAPAAATRAGAVGRADTFLLHGERFGGQRASGGTLRPRAVARAALPPDQIGRQIGQVERGDPRHHFPP